eukprot:CAMPEP_0202897540 /NCGR_PEP_ID=MMETSP1392-20130828/6277_1 /ASSEMBLY_ACC=CAM_ASM_000868 /TAXON_ID=225041 /ORGANISM="Chlamydomonas chlamydogama, Strain SAG 11-48b" /LENGTH=174 /DNA_ID=CAMNT_0049583213 /DNA_START=32 /DNA_END=556 /DNA_ORIENTATION=-
MDALMAYGASSDDDSSEQEAEPQKQSDTSKEALNTKQNDRAPATINADRKTTSPALKLPSAAELLDAGPGYILPPPDLDDIVTSTSSPPYAGGKRHLPRPQGVAPGQGPAKIAKGGSPQQQGPHTRSSSGSSALLPPQLRGRSNVVTEDLDRLFTKRKAPGAATGAGSPAQPTG